MITAFTDIPNCAGVWLSTGTLWQDSARTTPAVLDDADVGSWDDASGNGNHAQQATSGKRPILKTNILNGHPVVRFDGSDDILTLLSNLTGTSHTILMLVKPLANPGGYLAMFTAHDMGLYLSLAHSTPELLDGWGEFADRNINSQQVLSVGTWYRLRGQARSAADINLVKDGVITKFTAGASWQARTSSAIGADSSGVQNTNFDVAGIVFYTRALTNQECEDADRLLFDLFQTSAVPADPTVPSAVDGPLATIQFAWNPSDDTASIYKVERAPDVSGSAGSYAQVATVDYYSRVFVDTTCVPGTKYWYRVRANNSQGNSGYTTGVSATASARSNFVRSVGGLTFQSDNTLTGWTGDSQIISDGTKPQFVCWPTGVKLFGPTTGSGGTDSEVDGVREPSPLWLGYASQYCIYDAGDHTNGWVPRLRSSTTRFNTSTRLGIQAAGYNKVVSGTWPSVATGYLSEWNGEFQYDRVLGGSVFSDGINTGLTNLPYYWDAWKGSTVSGINTACANVPTSNQRYTETGGANEWLPGNKLPDLGRSRWVSFAQIITGCGVISAANRDGPWPQSDFVFVWDTTFPGVGGRLSENPKGFFHPGMRSWANMMNLIALSGIFTDANSISYWPNSSPTELNDGYLARTQNISPIDAADAIGVASFIGTLNSMPIFGPNGEVPILYDGTPTVTTNHLGRGIYAGELIPHNFTLRLSQSGNTTTYRQTRTLSHTDQVFEFAFVCTAVNGSGGNVYLEYRSDSSHQNMYRADFQINAPSSGISTGTVKLIKTVSGSDSTLSTSSSVSYETYQHYRCRVVISANVHKIYLNGLLAVTFTDSSSPIASGTNVNIAINGADCEVRGLIAYASDTLTLSGLPASAAVVLRTFGGMPGPSTTADGSGNATIQSSHWPYAAAEVNGVDYVVSGAALFGGDTVSVTAPASTGPFYYELNQGMSGGALRAISGGFQRN